MIVPGCRTLDPKKELQLGCKHHAPSPPIAASFLTRTNWTEATLGGAHRSAIHPLHSWRVANHDEEKLIWSVESNNTYSVLQT